MLRSAKQLRGYRVEAADGPIGKIADVYFDASTWAVRYLVVEAGGWLSGRRILLAPACCRQLDKSARVLTAALTRQQIESSSPTETDLSATQPLEAAPAAYYGWPDYWVGDPVFGAASVGFSPAFQPPAMAPERRDPGLRSARELAGFSVQACDGEIGRLADCLIEDSAWVIRYLVVETGHWLLGRNVLLASGWIQKIHWGEMKVSTDLRRERIRHAPAFDPGSSLTREDEERLYEHYGRRKYWES